MRRCRRRSLAGAQRPSRRRRPSAPSACRRAPLQSIPARRPSTDAGSRSIIIAVVPMVRAWPAAGLGRMAGPARRSSPAAAAPQTRLPRPFDSVLWCVRPMRARRLPARCLRPSRAGGGAMRMAMRAGRAAGGPDAGCAHGPCAPLAARPPHERIHLLASARDAGRCQSGAADERRVAWAATPSFAARAADERGAIARLVGAMARPRLGDGLTILGPASGEEP